MKAIGGRVRVFWRRNGVSYFAASVLMLAAAIAQAFHK